LWVEVDEFEIPIREGFVLLEEAIDLLHVEFQFTREEGALAGGVIVDDNGGIEFTEDRLSTVRDGVDAIFGEV